MQSQLLKEVGMSPERYIWVQCCLGKESAKALRPEAAPGLFEERQTIQRGRWLGEIRGCAQRP